jgi:ABC-type methionine transport system ATPase subunit
VRLTFPSELVQQPIIYRLVADFGIVPNIRRADVRADHGWMVLELEASDDKLEQGVAWLRQQGIKVDPIEGDMVLP